jgi:hypothetical protein
MKILKNILMPLMLLNWLLVGGLFAGQETVDKTYENIQSIKLKLVLGNCDIMKSPDGKVYVHLVYESGQHFSPDFSERSGKLTLEESFSDHNREGNEPHWILKVPAGMEIDLNSATGSITVNAEKLEMEGNSGTGSIEVSGSSGKFELSSGTGDIMVKNTNGKLELNSGTGNVLVENSQGNFEVNSGTGNVQGNNITIEADAEFNSGTGNVMVSKPEGNDFKLELNSGTNDAVLDFQGKKIEGYFEFRAHATKGDIISPVPFDDEKEYRDNGSSYVVKSFSRGKDKPQYFISTGTGEAELKK